MDTIPEASVSESSALLGANEILSMTNSGTTMMNSGTPGAKSMKHFKKSMIFEYEKIENSTLTNEESSSSTSSTSSTSSASTHSSNSNSSTSSTLSASAPISFANTSISKHKYGEQAASDSKKAKHSNKRKRDRNDESASSMTHLDKTSKVYLDLYEDEHDEAENEHVKKQLAKSKENKTSNDKKPITSSSKSKSNDKITFKKDSTKIKSSQSQSTAKGAATSSKSSSDIYCVCKTSDSNGFMIACDKCDEWYHGDCVGVSQSLSKKIKAFFCHLCRYRDSNLKIKYKNKIQPYVKLMHQQQRERHDTSHNTSSSSETNSKSFKKFVKETQIRKKKESELIIKYLSDKAKKKLSASSTNAVVKSNEAKSDKSSNKLSTLASATSIVSSLSPSLNSSSSSSVAPKVYGHSKVSTDELELFSFAISRIGNDAAVNANIIESNQSEQQPTTSIKTETDTSNNMPNKENDRFSSHGASLSKKSNVKKVLIDSEDNNKNNINNYHSYTNANFDANVHSNCVISGDSNDMKYSSENETTNSSNLEKMSASSLDDNEVDEDNDDEDDDDDDDFELDSRKLNKMKRSDEVNNKHKSKKSKTNVGVVAAKRSSKSGSIESSKLLVQTSKTKKPSRQSHGVTQQAKPKPRRQRNSSSTNLNKNDEMSENKATVVKKKEPEQCIGPECVNAAAENSKYCSFECGMRLAKNRLSNFLKPSYDTYSKLPCFTDQLNVRELERINNEINSLKSELKDLELKHLELDKLIDRAKDYKINPNVEKDRDKYMDSNETEIYCVTCGHILSEKQALKHMEKCFNKIESQAFFGSYFKTQIEKEGDKSVFCDYYHATSKMYCKRLKVMCSEHEKEQKINDNEVCGYPLPKPNKIIEDSARELCLAPKKSCTMHFKWEKLRRAQIDLEKLRTGLKLEELLEQKRMNEASLAQRGGLLSILLNQTRPIDPLKASNSTTNMSETSSITTTTTPTYFNNSRSLSCSSIPI